MKQTLKATTKAAEEFANSLEAIGAGACSVFNELNQDLARKLNKVSSAVFDNEEKRDKRWAEYFEALDEQQQQRIIATANALTEGMRQYQKALGERYNPKNLEENLKRHREVKR